MNACQTTSQHLQTWWQHSLSFCTSRHHTHKQTHTKTKLDSLSRSAVNEGHRWLIPVILSSIWRYFLLRLTLNEWNVMNSENLLHNFSIWKIFVNLLFARARATSAPNTNDEWCSVLHEFAVAILMQTHTHTHWVPFNRCCCCLGCTNHSLCYPLKSLPSFRDNFRAWKTASSWTIFFLSLSLSLQRCVLTEKTLLNCTLEILINWWKSKQFGEVAQQF